MLEKAPLEEEVPPEPFKKVISGFFRNAPKTPSLPNPSWGSNRSSSQPVSPLILGSPPNYPKGYSLGTLPGFPIKITPNSYLVKILNRF